jgi:hypothetical protein
MHYSGPGDYSLGKFFLGIPGKVFYEIAVKFNGAVGVSLISHIKDFDAAEIHLLSLPGLTVTLT